MRNYKHFVDNINNLEIRKTIVKFIDGFLSMDKNRKNYYISDFFSPLEFQYVKKFLNFEKIDYRLVFENEDYERNVILVTRNSNFEISNFIDVIKFKDDNFEHRNILGSILNLGINREKIGDILKINGNWYVYCLKPMGDFLFTHLDRISKSKVKVEVLDYFESFENFREFEIMKIMISSMRLDCIVKELAKVSRENAKSLIRGQNVKLNYEDCKDFDKKVEFEDIISIRGKGKFKIFSHCGYSKKDKSIIEVKRYV